jgi:hypothetical protein
MDGTTFAGVLASDRQSPDIRVVLNSADAAPPPDVSVSAFLKMARKGELVIEKSKCRVREPLNKAPSCNAIRTMRILS